MCTSTAINHSVKEVFVKVRAPSDIDEPRIVEIRKCEFAKVRCARRNLPQDFAKIKGIVGRGFRHAVWWLNVGEVINLNKKLLKVAEDLEGKLVVDKISKLVDVSFRCIRLEVDKYQFCQVCRGQPIIAFRHTVRLRNQSLPVIEKFADAVVFTSLVKITVDLELKLFQSIQVDEFAECSVC